MKAIWYGYSVKYDFPCQLFIYLIFWMEGPISISFSKGQGGPVVGGLRAEYKAFDEQEPAGSEPQHRMSRPPVGMEKILATISSS